MRISADPESEYFHPVSRWCNVFLNGEPLYYVVEADTKTNTILQWDLPSYLHDPIKMKVHGKLEVRFQDDAPSELVKDFQERLKMKQVEDSFTTDMFSDQREYELTAGQELIKADKRVGKYLFKNTGAVFPEQYDIIDTDTEKVVGYARLRNSRFRVYDQELPTSTPVLNVTFSDHNNFGAFDEDEVRMEWLQAAATALDFSLSKKG